jgi:DNA-binding transcriptional LysR family regulator
MKLSLEVLTVLDAIDRRGSYAAAAEELHRVSSALSYQVLKLESDLGVQVFDRSGHRAVLTPTGRLLLEEGRQLLRAAQSLEERARRIDRGWEPVLRIALDATLPFALLLPEAQAFTAAHADTELRFGREVLGGCWDALVTRRADLAVGAVGEPPAGVGLSVRPLGELEVAFCVAPGHPLADAPEPLAWEQIQPHRVVSMADSSHRLPARSLNVAAGQPALSVPDLQAKLAAQLAGLGCGHLPLCLAQPHLNAGRLVAKRLAEARPPQRFHLAWRTADTGPALRWWVERLLARPGLVSAETLAANSC